MDMSNSLRLGNILLYISALLGLFFLQWILTAIYNVYFHPLRKYPGPKLAAATRLVYAFYQFKGEEAAWTRELHDRYGETVRLRPDGLSYISPQAWKDITGHRLGGRQENKKDTRFYGPDLNGEYSLISTHDTDQHGQIRRIFTNAFSDKALRLQEPMIRIYVDKLVHNIRRDVTADPRIQLDAVKLYNCTTFDIMGDLAFAEPLGMLENSEYTPWVKSIFGNIKSLVYRNTIRMYPWLSTVVHYLQPQSVMDLAKNHFAHSAERVDRRLARGVDVGKADIWRLVLERGKDQLTLGEMHTNASLFMTAGTETTATLLSGLTYYLLVNPEKLRKVVEEVRALSKEDLSLEKLPQQPYLNACFEEALRMYPPTPTGLPRVTPQGGCTISGHYVPPNTVVYVSPYPAFRSALNFKNPDSFIPERWLEGSGYESDRKAVFQPFSYGPRNCIGKNLAYHEMRLILASVLWHFDLELCPESLTWPQQKTYILWEKPELCIKAKPVQGS